MVLIESILNHADCNQNVTRNVLDVIMISAKFAITLINLTQIRSAPAVTLAAPTFLTQRLPKTTEIDTTVDPNAERRDENTDAGLDDAASYPRRVHSPTSEYPFSSPRLTPVDRDKSDHDAVEEKMVNTIFG